jgi:O-acetyl-ADP-ribose deacetylase (regulator of RNase III)
MDNHHYQWRIASVTLHVIRGDIFSVPVDSLVNSEQTDFLLAKGGSSISSQIWKAFGPTVQDELVRKTNNEVLQPPVVLTTSGGKYACIFHAGFHLPYTRHAKLSDDEGTEHLEIIRYCVRQILEMVHEANFSSVAFPLIGAGIFGLDPGLVARNFFDDILSFAVDSRTRKDMEVWLVAYDEPTFHTALQSGIQAWLSHTSTQHRYELFSLGVPHLDAFEQQLVREAHPQWAAWLHVRFAELVIGYAMFVMAAGNSLTPQQAVDEGKLMTFGQLRKRSRELSAKVRASTSFSDWSTFLGKIVFESEATQVVDRLNVDRNAIAHGRNARSVADIRADVAALLHGSEWRALSQRIAPPNHVELSPWLVKRGDGGSASKTEAVDIGVFEKWDKEKISYLIPCSGTFFQTQSGATRSELAQLWNCQDQNEWFKALDRYWEHVLPCNVNLEREMESLDVEEIKKLAAQPWYGWLLDKYFRWKYTAKNRYATSTNQLRKYEKESKLAELHGIQQAIFQFDLSDIRSGLSIACRVRGLGTAGASGLLSILFPNYFGTVDQFVVKALRDIYGSDQDLGKMNPEALTVQDGTVLITIMRKKADELNGKFRTNFWTPRKIDKILWTFGR